MNQFIRRLGIACVTTLGIADVACVQAPANRAPFSVKMIGFNDYHGNLQSPGTFGTSTAVPPAERPAVGGAEYIAAYVSKLKAQNPLNVVVGAGDFIGAVAKPAGVGSRHAAT